MRFTVKVPSYMLCSTQPQTFIWGWVVGHNPKIGAICLQQVSMCASPRRENGRTYTQSELLYRRKR